MSDNKRDAAALRRELQRIRQEVETNLTHGARVGPHVRQIRREVLDDLQRLGVGLDFYETLAFFRDVREADRLFMQIVASGLDARQIEKSR